MRTAVSTDTASAVRSMVSVCAISIAVACGSGQTMTGVSMTVGRPKTTRSTASMAASADLRAGAQ